MSRTGKALGALLTVCALLLGGCAGAKTPADGYIFTDDTGAQITAPRKPETVAVLTSSLAELWITAGGAVDITVGETEQRGITQGAVPVDAGAGKTIDLERLIAAKPELVIYSAELAGQAACADALKAAGIPAAGFSVETLEDYLQVLKIATDILDTPQRYETYGTQVKEAADQLLRQQYPVKILFVRAGSSAKYTKAKTAENHFVCQMLAELGTENIADAAPVLLDGLSMEEILLADPDVIFYTAMGDEAAAQSYMDSLVRDPVWQALTAVKSGRVHHLPKDLFQYKPNSRWAEAYGYLIACLEVIP